MAVFDGTVKAVGIGRTDALGIVGRELEASSALLTERVIGIEA